MFIANFFTGQLGVFSITFLIFSLIAWICSYALASEKIFLCTTVAFFSVCEIASVFYDMPSESARVLRGASLLISTFLCGLLFAVCKAKEKIKKRRLQREEVRKNLQFTLPERDNEFIRTRLNTVLKDKEGKVDLFFCNDFRFSYIKKLICGLKGRSLSPADRLKTEEYAGIIGAYAGKENWSLDEMENLNEILSAVLKLSAKYSL